jgi:hypothetical protein
MVAAVLDQQQRGVVAQSGFGVIGDVGGETSSCLSDRDIFDGSPDEKVGQTVTTEEAPSGDLDSVIPSE